MAQAGIVFTDASGGLVAFGTSTITTTGGIGPPGPAGPSATALFVQTVSTEVADTTTETSLINESGALGELTILADSFVEGDQLRITAWGRYSTKETGAGTLTIEAGLGAEIIAAFEPVELNGSQSAQPWDAVLNLVRHTDGASGVVSGYGQLTIGRTNMEPVHIPLSISPTVISSEADKEPSFTGKWSVQHADNSFLCYGVKVDPLGAPA